MGMRPSARQANQARKPTAAETPQTTKNDVLLARRLVVGVLGRGVDEQDQSRGRGREAPGRCRKSVFHRFWRPGRCDLEVDRIAAGLADEPGERVPREEDVRVDVGRVADERRVEVPERPRQRAAHEREDPRDRRDREERDRRPEPEPDQVRDREQEPEEDRQPRAAAGRRRTTMPDRVRLHRPGLSSIRRGRLRPTRLTRAAGARLRSRQMTPPVRTWWAWRRERSGSVAC